MDDAPDMCLLVRSRLEVEGAKVQSCSSGEEAVNVVNRAPDSFDLILMDINLPKMDGHSATENIRRLGFLRPVLAFSAYPIKEKEADRFKKSGFNEFVSKAVDCEKLISIVQSWVA